MTEQEQPMTDTAPTGSAWTWVYRTFAITGIAAGIFIIAAGLWLLFAPPSWYNARTHGCASMEADIKQMKQDMENHMKNMKESMKNMPGMSSMPSTSMSPMPNMPSMSPMPNMPSMSSMPNMPSTSPMPNMPMPPR